MGASKIRIRIGIEKIKTFAFSKNYMGASKIPIRIGIEKIKTFAFS